MIVRFGGCRDDVLKVCQGHTVLLVSTWTDVAPGPGSHVMLGWLNAAAFVREPIYIEAKRYTRLGRCMVDVLYVEVSECSCVAKEP